MSETAEPPAGILPDSDAPPLAPADRAIVEAMKLPFGAFSDYWNRVCRELPNRKWCPAQEIRHAYEEGYRDALKAAAARLAEAGNE